MFRILISGITFALATAVYSQENPDEDESPWRPGLVATYEVPGGATCGRIDETIAFDWQAAPPDPRLGSGKFQAAWKGRLWTQATGQYRLHAFVNGRVKVKLDGREMLAGESTEPKWLSSEPLDLSFDYRPLEVEFQKTGERAQLALYWSGPNFLLEPIPDRFLFHDKEATLPGDFARGQRLAAALRCDACHSSPQSKQPLAAPALDRLAGNIQPAWLVDWLSREGEAPAEPPGSAGASPSQIVRRMPHFGLSQDEATAVAAWLLRLPPEKLPPPATPKAEPKPTAKSKTKKAAPSATEGERLFLTLGCLACHQHGELGESGLFGGGDLTKIAAKRPAEFFARWLADPASLNRHHRMPVFELSADERTSLSLWLAQQQPPVGNALRGVPNSTDDIAAGEKLIGRFRCAACHTLPTAEQPKLAGLNSLTAASDWSRSCTGQSDPQKTRPGYRLMASDQAALRSFYSTALSARGTPQRAFPTAGTQSPQSAGRELLVELNCLACHHREGIDRTTNALPARLQEKLAAVVAIHDDLGKLVPAMTPPALNSVGDKLTDAALAASIRRQGPPHRPYLMARMPRFNLTDEQLASLTAYFTATDRIPPNSPLSPRGRGAGGEGVPAEPPEPRPMVAALVAAGPRLVTTDGFGCTSCHQVGSVRPDKAPLNARGPDISQLGQRIRREWFDRWCNNPARIVPRMEMPSVQVPVRGVLGEKIGDQLAAVWHTLNTPGFEPPEPNPVRVLRLSGVPERKEAPIVLHDVIKDGDKTWLFPLVIGLPNRHNILFDLETNRLAAWWLGDTARQRTKGKSWYWEQGGKPLVTPFSDPEIAFDIEGHEWLPRLTGQFAGQLVSYEKGNLTYRMTLSASKGEGEGDRLDQSVLVRQNFAALENSTGFRRYVSTSGIGELRATLVRLVSPEIARQSRWDQETKTLRLPGSSGVTIRIEPGNAPVEWHGNGIVSLREQLSNPPRNRWSSSFGLTYNTSLPVDAFLADPPAAIPVAAAQIEVAPGFNGRRLPLPDDIMPTAMDWKPDGRLLMTTLKGQVLAVEDTDDDGLHDKAICVMDGLATPYGLSCSQNLDFVVVKGGVLRLLEGFGDMYASVEVVASGWGVTDDYHDWAIGLVRGKEGEYYIGLPCQQDDRSEAAAKYRGQILKLVPRQSMKTLLDRFTPAEFAIETVSTGHRFPMGLALNREGALFVSDNQGNYNPFNELNHVRPGAFFGFVNAIDKKNGMKPPPLTAPAIDIPHPWTRSVNGICFLDTPSALREGDGKSVFGPLEGHLIGCEYDTRALIRMTLQKVGETYQGAAYPLSIPPRNIEDGLLGPLVCAVSPRGELYVGNVRDSGWGAGNNVGDIVKIKIEPEKLPCGIQEVRATKDGFTVDFFRPIDPAKGADPGNYSIASYRRESTPAYGGPNLDRRVEKIAAVQVSPDAKRVTLRLDNLRPGFVYEFQLKPLTRGKELFHPAEAHYTLRQIPH